MQRHLPRQIAGEQEWGHLFRASQLCRSDVEEKSLCGSCCNPTWVVCRAKSFAADLVTERGIVNGRVAPGYDPLRLSLRLEICPPSGWCYIREATAASCGAVASLEALLLCLYLGESSAGCATVCDMHSAHISKLCCVSQ